MAKIKKIYFKLNMNMLLFCLGIIVGTIVINCLYRHCDNTSYNLISDYFGNAGTYNSFGEVFFEVFIRRIVLAAVIIAVFELFNNIWIVYFLLSTLGMFTGIVMTVLSMNIGIKSIGVFTLMCFPHIFIYALAGYILTCLKFSGYYIMRLKEPYTKGYVNKKRGYILIASIFVVGILAETFNALYILPKMFNVFGKSLM